MKSIWNLNEKYKPYGRLEENKSTQVLVIGGGLTGCLCAYHLKQAGIPCILVEAKQIASGITRNTTAKITAQHGLLYAELIQQKGIELARQYYAVNQKAVESYREIAGADCDFENKTAYVFSQDTPKKLEQEAAAYQKLGIPMEWKKHSPLPFSTAGALGMENQAQFHPLKFIRNCLDGIEIYENTFVSDIQENRAITKNGTITADHIILATHYPMKNIPGLYFMKLYQQRSYIMAFKDAANIDGMYIDEKENGFSFRNYKDNLLIGGGGHKTGKNGDCFEGIRQLTKKAYPNASEVCFWAAQDCMSLDHIPYIGVHSRNKSNLYVTTGYNKWGMTSSMVAAMALTEIITTGRSEYENLFSPQRSMISSQLMENMANSIGSLLRPGKRCSHMGCALRWNSVENTWDCPCHGSRFSDCGDIIDNPAKRGIHIE